MSFSSPKTFFCFSRNDYKLDVESNFVNESNSEPLGFRICCARRPIKTFKNRIQCRTTSQFCKPRVHTPLREYSYSLHGPELFLLVELSSKVFCTIRHSVVLQTFHLKVTMAELWNSYKVPDVLSQLKNSCFVIKYTPLQLPLLLSLYKNIYVICLTH